MPSKQPSSRGKPYQSKLNSVAGVISTLRQQRRTYADISRILREQHGISVAPSTIFNFIKVRSRKRRSYQLVEMACQPPSSLPAPIPRVQPSGTSNSSAEAIERLKRSKPAEAPRKLFTFDENKPLTLNP